MNIPIPFPPFPTKPPPKARSHVKHKFTTEEDDRLAEIVTHFGESNWKGIAARLGGRTCRQCRERWKNYLDPNLNRERWSSSEDDLLIAKYAQFGSQWSVIAKFFRFRTDVACKNRWVVLTSHTDQPKRVRSRKEKGKDSNSDLWTWNEVEVKQAYDETDGFGVDGAGFIGDLENEHNLFPK
jgi:hypothetical protein